MKAARLLACLLSATTAVAGLPGRPVPQWTWQGSARRPEAPKPIQPVLAQLDDDDGDGRVDELDRPDVIFLSTDDTLGRIHLHAVDGADGTTKWDRDITALRPMPWQLATADANGDGAAEIFLIANDGLEILELDSGGALRRQHAARCQARSSLVIADVDGDGVADVACPGSVTSLSGTWWPTGQPPYVGYAHASIADIRLDLPGLETLVGASAWDARGTLLWERPGDDGAAAVTDFEPDGAPEIVIARDLRIFVMRADGTDAAPPLRLDDEDRLLGPPVIADATGDGVPEVVAGGHLFLACWEWRPEGLVRRWQVPTANINFGIPVTAFDFDGDGLAEIVHRDDATWSIFDGASGAVLHAGEAFESWTTVEHPIVADIDGDPDAEIVIAGWFAAGPPSSDRVTAYSVPGSRTPRSTWNEHGYHGCNIRENGTLPREEPPSWRAHRSWGAQVSPGECVVACAPIVVRQLADVTACEGEPAVLDASGIVLSGCGEPADRAWQAEDGTPLGSDAQLVLSPARAGVFEMSLTCPAFPECSITETVEVSLHRRPGFGVATATDPSECADGLLLEWDEAIFQLGPGDGVYNVYRSEDPLAPSCADALARPPIATALMALSWRDADAGTVPRAYVIEAEDRLAPTECAPSGPAFGGATTRACLPVIADGAGPPRPEGVFAALRARHRGDEVTLDWSRARPLLAGEHAHVRKAALHPSRSWQRIHPDPAGAVTHAETDVTAPIQFFEVRVANACEEESESEYGVLP